MFELKTMYVRTYIIHTYIRTYMHEHDPVSVFTIGYEIHQKM